MKKLLTALICGAITFIASADFKTMEFDTGDGTPKYISINNLKIVFENGLMKAASGDSQLEISVSDLVSMQFSGNEAGVESLLDYEGQVEIISLNGVSCGNYDNPAQAGKSLPEGIYIVKKNDGSTLKIRLTK